MKNLFKLMGVLSLLSTSAIAQNTFPTNGNVGIGTATPSERLDVNGNMVVDSSVMVKDSVIIEKDLRTKGAFRVEDKAYFFDRVYIYDQLESTSKIITEESIEVGNNANVDNNVNIGNKLSVDGATSLNGSVKLSNLAEQASLNNPNLEILIKTNSGDVKTYKIVDLVEYLSQEPLEPALCPPGDIQNPQWYSAVNKIYSYCPQVNVGISTNNPLHKLHVVGRAFASRMMAGNALANSNAVISGFAINNTYPLLDLGRKIGGLDQSSRFVVANDGSLTIDNDGTNASLVLKNGDNNAIEVYDNTGYKIFQLQNDGLMRSREIRVDLENNWPDYVFSANYELLTLDELAKFIKLNGHLPGVPSAIKLENEGLDLGEMQRTQMEKIEEQTLYTLELHNEVEQLKTENNELKSELDNLKAEMESIKQLLTK